MLVINERYSSVGIMTNVTLSHVTYVYNLHARFSPILHLFHYTSFLHELCFVNLQLKCKKMFIAYMWSLLVVTNAANT